ncbi:MAG: hypothetical protein OEZ06_22905 [Myxococcales bacterium]|nr:hypothetical protein [Myxococcales bacterium]
MHRFRTFAIGLALSAIALGGCAEREHAIGHLQMLLKTDHALIFDGVHETEDGWLVDFSKFVVVVSDVNVERKGESFSSSESYARDLARDATVAPNGHVLGDIERVPSGVYDGLGFKFVAASADDQLPETNPDAVIMDLEGLPLLDADGGVRTGDPGQPGFVDPVDHERMVDEGLTHLIEGELFHKEGASRIDVTPFSFAVKAPTSYSDCAPRFEGEPLLRAYPIVKVPVIMNVRGEGLFEGGADWMLEAAETPIDETTVDAGELEKRLREMVAALDGEGNCKAQAD